MRAVGWTLAAHRRADRQRGARHRPARARPRPPRRLGRGRPLHRAQLALEPDRGRLHRRRLRLGARVRARRRAARRALSRVAGGQPDADRGAPAGVGILDAAVADPQGPVRAARRPSGSFVTSRIVVPRCARTLWSSSTICSPFAESSAPVGSSASRSRGSFASARAIATRWRSPPESVGGYADTRSERPTSSRRSPGALHPRRGGRGRARTSAAGRSRPPSASGSGCGTGRRSRRPCLGSAHRPGRRAARRRRVISPELGRSSAPIRFSSVLLPQPDGPVIETSSPGSTRKETSTSAAMRPSSNDRETWSTTTSAPPPRAVTSPGSSR